MHAHHIWSEDTCRVDDDSVASSVEAGRIGRWASDVIVLVGDFSTQQSVELSFVEQGARYT